MSDQNRAKARCCMCGEPVMADTQWVSFNRIAIGRGGKRALLEYQHGDQRISYRWDLDTLDASGLLLCWPHCAMTWLEGELIEHDWVK